MKQVPIILTSLFFAVIAWWVWPKSTDAFVDFGREIYVAWRVSEGELPGGDFDYFNGPLSPCLNGLVFTVFPASVNTLKLANTAIAAICTLLLFVLLTRLAGEWLAMCGCMLFCMTTAFSTLGYEPYFSLLAPYSHEMSHGLLLLLAIFVLLSWKSAWSMALQGACVGLAALTKPEILLACLAAAVIPACLRAWSGRRVDLKQIGALAAGAVLPVLGAFLYLLLRSDADTALAAMAGAWAYLGNEQLVNGPRYQALRGMDHPMQNLLAALAWAGAWILFAAGCIALSRTLQRAVANGMAVAVSIAIFAIGWNRVDFLSVSRPLFLLLPLVMIGLWRDRNRQKDDPLTDRVADLSFIALAICGACLVLVLKVILDAKLSHYGFVLAAPGCILLMGILAGPITSRINAPVAQVAAGSVMLCLTAWLIHRNVDAMQYRLIMLPVAAQDEFAVEPVRGMPLSELLADLRQSHHVDRTVAVVPAGAMVNFLIRERNPTGQLTLLPVDLLMFGEDRALDDFRSHPPDLIVLMHTDSSVHGARFFGEDYARDLAVWIRTNYRPVKQYGALPFTGPAFGILLLERLQ